jgi:GR25 family glycosyltransferase involved in LPS biosynthesis
MKSELSKLSSFSYINSIERVDAVTPSYPGERVVGCCTKSHIKAMNSLTKDWVLVLEDDVDIDEVLFNESIKSIQHVLDTNKSQIFYLGMSSAVYPYIDSDTDIVLVKKKNKMVIGAYAYMVNRKFITDFVININIPIDMQLSIGSDECICCVPSCQLKTQTYYRLISGSGSILTKDTDTTLNISIKNKIKYVPEKNTMAFVLFNRYLYGMMEVGTAVAFSISKLKYGKYQLDQTSNSKLDSSSFQF